MIFIILLALSDMKFTGEIVDSNFGSGCLRFGSISNDTVCAAPGEGAVLSCDSSSAVSITLPNGTTLFTDTYMISFIRDIDIGNYTCKSSPPCADMATIELILPSKYTTGKETL